MASPIQWLRKLKATSDFGRTFNQLWVIKDMKGGVFVGKDQFGNRYYEDKDETWGRHRHVEYAAYDYDPSQIPAHWRKWLHYTHTEAPQPNQDSTPIHKWVSVKHAENFSGTPKAYKPYSTVKDKIETWQGVVKERV